MVNLLTSFSASVIGQLLQKQIKSEPESEDKMHTCPIQQCRLSSNINKLQKSDHRNKSTPHLKNKQTKNIWFFERKPIFFNLI